VENPGKKFNESLRKEKLDQPHKGEEVRISIIVRHASCGKKTKRSEKGGGALGGGRTNEGGSDGKRPCQRGKIFGKNKKNLLKEEASGKQDSRPTPQTRTNPH